jgi:hypothetical protein
LQYFSFYPKIDEFTIPDHYNVVAGQLEHLSELPEESILSNLESGDLIYKVGQLICNLFGKILQKTFVPQIRSRPSASFI